MQKERCLVICPTINRSSQFTIMANSFYKNSKCSDLLVLTKKGSITEIINQVNYDGYKYISVTNDDFVYHTEGWDRILINKIEQKGFGIAFGNDGTNNKHLPVTAVMTADIFRALGWVQYPKLDHLCGDMVWQYIGKKLNCLYYVQDVKIEHMHFLFNKGKKEDYEHTNSKEMYQKDNKVFKEWIIRESESDLEKIRANLVV